MTDTKRYWKENEWNEQFNVYREATLHYRWILEKRLQGEFYRSEKTFYPFDYWKNGFLLVLQVGESY